MMLNLTHDQMLEYWRLLRYHEPVNDPLAIVEEEGYGVDTSRILGIEMRDWYLHLLDTAPVEWLPVSDLASDVSLRMCGDGSGLIELPQECHRILSVALDCWSTQPTIITDPCSPLARLQRNPLTRGGLTEPVVIHTPGRLHLYTPQTGARINELRCVKAPSDGRYTFDERALASIINPSLIPQ